MKTSLFLSVLLLQFPATAASVKLSENCKQKLENQVLKIETNRVLKTGEQLSADLELNTYLNNLNGRLKATVRITDQLDGRSSEYLQLVSEEQVLNCKIKFTQKNRSSSASCRYSTDEGPEGLNSIAGLKMSFKETIKPEDSLNSIQERQIKRFLGENEMSVAELIESTDDKSLTYGSLHLPNGETLDYYGAYGGDNPFGIFFLQNDTVEVGTNGDGFICIRKD